MGQLPSFQADTPADQIRAALEEHGGVIVENFLPPALLQNLNTDLENLIGGANPAMRHLNPRVHEFYGPHVRHVSGLPGKSKAFAEDVMCNPIMLDLCDRILLPNCAEYVLNLGHLMERRPGAERQWLHRDQDSWKHLTRLMSPAFEIQVSSVVALNDFTVENGATAIVSGSHRWPLDRAPREDEIAYAAMKAGSAVVYLGSTIHAGGLNSTPDQWRRGFHISYVLGWLRTEENNILAVPPDVARTLSTRAQRLVGYGVHDAIKIKGGYLGMMDMRDPGELLKEGLL